MLLVNLLAALNFANVFLKIKSLENKKNAKNVKNVTKIKNVKNDFTSMIHSSRMHCFDSDGTAIKPGVEHFDNKR